MNQSLFLIRIFHFPKAFVNLVTVIPVPDDNNETAFFVGLQIDLVEQPGAILEKMKSKLYSKHATLFQLHD